MKNILSILLITISLSAFGREMDTVDIWTVKVNNETLIKSDVFHLKSNNVIHIGKYADSDTIKFIYWTDSGLQNMDWTLRLRDINNNLLDTKANETDPNLDKMDAFNKSNQICFTVGYLKKLLAEKEISQLFIHHYHTYSSDVANREELLFIIKTID